MPEHSQDYCKKKVYFYYKVYFFRIPTRNPELLQAMKALRENTTSGALSI